MKNNRSINGLVRISSCIDAITEMIGNTVAWLILVAIIISAGNAISRKFFSLSSNAWLEVQWVLFGAVFMLAAPHVLRLGKHVRVDLIYRVQTLERRTWVDLLGHVLFLLPFCVLMLIYGIPFAAKSLASNEFSINPGGLPLWPAKILIPLGFLLLLGQAVSEIMKCIAVLCGNASRQSDDQDYPSAQ
jgi:TRAP-type mannitol/chloroaromatic compound transport system permease small subunit